QDRHLFLGKAAGQEQVALVLELRELLEGQRHDDILRGSGRYTIPAMKPEDILSHRARVLSQVQRERYFATGYLAAEGLIPDSWLDRLSALSDRFLDKSRAIAASN